jgi:hypothetical protein
MSDSLEKISELVGKASLCAKELVLKIPDMNDEVKSGLHEKALNMLLLISKVETSLEALREKRIVRGGQLGVVAGMSDEEVLAVEVNKLNKRLPRWARNLHQINSQIMSCFLRAAAESAGCVTEESLRDEFVKHGGNQDQFNKNFPQMKVISERNHGKVFDVVDGLVYVWPPAQPAVDAFIEEEKFQRIK